MNAARVLSMLAIAVVTTAVCVGLGSDAQQRSDAARPMPVGAPITCVGDLNGDGVVNVSDLLALLGAWGPNPGHAADINGDGVVNVSDLLILLGAWGDCPGIPPGTVYTELNYIDPFGNGCPAQLCTNGNGGAISFKNLATGVYYSPSTIWTQSHSGYLEELRVIVSGQNSAVNPTYGFSSSSQFAAFAYRVELWEGFAEFAMSPQAGTLKTMADLVPGNFNYNVPVGYNANGYDTFEWVFDLTEYKWLLQEGQEYVIMLRPIGSTANGYVMRVGSSIDDPADVSANNTQAPGYVNQPPYNWPVNRIGTEIRVRTPSSE